MITSGTLVADHLTFRLMRKEKKSDEGRVKVYEGQIKELRRFKDLVPSVELGMECGIILHDEFPFRTGDILEQVEEYEEPRNVEEEFEKATQRELAQRQQAQDDADAASAESGGMPVAEATVGIAVPS